MRFKGLRRAVGTSIVLFILIIGIIMLSGLIHNPRSQNVNVAPSQGRNNFINANVVQSPTQEQQPSTQVAYHPRLMTGAS